MFHLNNLVQQNKMIFFYFHNKNIFSRWRRCSNFNTRAHQIRFEALLFFNEFQVFSVWKTSFWWKEIYYLNLSEIKTVFFVWETKRAAIKILFRQPWTPKKLGWWLTTAGSGPALDHEWLCLFVYDSNDAKAKPNQTEECFFHFKNFFLPSCSSSTKRMNFLVNIWSWEHVLVDVGNKPSLSPLPLALSLHMCC